MARPGDGEALARPHRGTVWRINPTADAAPPPTGQPGKGEATDDNGVVREGDLLSRGRSG